MSHKHHHEPEQDNEILKEIRHILGEILGILRHEELNDSITLSIGGNMGQPATLVLGQPAVQAQAQESKGGVPSVDANGNNTFNGPLAFSSDNSSVASVDPASGLVTSVAVGSCNITVLDAVGNLSDSVAVTVIPGTTPPTQNDSISLSIPSQTASGRRR